MFIGLSLSFFFFFSSLIHPSSVILSAHPLFSLSSDSRLGACIQTVTFVSLLLRVHQSTFNHTVSSITQWGSHFAFFAYPLTWFLFLLMSSPPFYVSRLSVREEKEPCIIGIHEQMHFPEPSSHSPKSIQAR